MSPAEISASVETAKQKQRLVWYEDQIRTKAKALASIFIELRNDPIKPWKCAHESYEQYCEEVWGMTPRRLQQIAAGESVKALLAAEAPDIAEVVRAMPEGQARVITTIPVEKRAEVVREAITAPGKMTAEKIKQAKARVIEVDIIAETTPKTKQSKKAKCCPTCHRPL